MKKIQKKYTSNQCHKTAVKKHLKRQEKAYAFVGLIAVISFNSSINFATQCNVNRAYMREIYDSSRLQSKKFKLASPYLRGFDFLSSNKKVTVG